MNQPIQVMSKNGRIPGLVNQVNHALQQGVERCAGKAVQLGESPVLEPEL